MCVSTLSFRRKTIMIESDDFLSLFTAHEEQQFRRFLLLTWVYDVLYYIFRSIRITVRLTLRRRRRRLVIEFVPTRTQCGTASSIFLVFCFRPRVENGDVVNFPSCFPNNDLVMWVGGGKNEIENMGKSVTVSAMDPAIRAQNSRRI